MYLNARTFLSVAVLLALAAIGAYGQNNITPGSVGLDSSIRCISVEWPCTGDADHDATCATQYRAQGSGTWLDAMNLLRCDNSDHNGFYGSIFNLNAGTAYEVKVTITDPDGGGTSYTGTVSTRNPPAMPSGGHTYHVVPGTSGGSGTSGDPFRGIATAEAVAQPGDIFLLHVGDYGLAQLTKSGTANNWIVWKAAGDGNAVIQGMYIKSYVWIDGLYFQLGSQHLQNNDWVSLGRSNGLTVPDGGNASNVVVTRCTFRDFFHTVKTRSGNTWYFADNDLRGDRDPLTGGLQGEGIELQKSYNNIVCYNKFRRNADPISYPGKNDDIYGNDIQDSSDDGVETDGGKVNVRVYENKITNAYNNTFTFQPMSMGPWYFVRNQVVLTIHKIWKFSAGGSIDDRFMAVNNTFIFPDQACQYSQCLWNAFHKNNLYISYNGTASILEFRWESSSPGEPGVSDVPFWMTEWDYNGYDFNNKTNKFTWYGTNYTTLAAFVAAFHVDTHSVSLDRNQIFSWTTPSTTYDWDCPLYTLASGTNAAVDAGTVLPNITDGYTGSAPDLGAFERGVTPPSYGPRPIGSTYSLTVNSGSGDGSYTAGTVVNIVADTPQSGYQFDRWTGDTDHVTNFLAANTTLTMPSHSTTVTATYSVIPTYSLTVNSGTGDGSYAAGTVVNIVADAPQTGYQFDRWTGDTDHVANFLASSTSVTMPSHAVTVTASYVSVPTYSLTVTSGTGSGSYYNGQVVNIVANTPPGGYIFSKWTGDTDHVANPNASSTTVTMPSHSTSVTATYVAVYALTVTSGSGDGSYTQGTVVTITADPPPGGDQFDQWTGDVDHVANVNSATTTVTMPNHAVSVTATYTSGALYTLTVTSGTGDGSYNAGTIVNIVADAPPAHYHFSKWTGDTATVANANAASTTIAMPAANANVTATYAEDAKYTLTVNSGTGDGSYYLGTVVNIAADTPASGYAFSMWAGDIAYLANPYSSSTTVSMPAQAVTVTATYVPTSGNDTFIESSGQVVMEVEHFSSKSSGTGSYTAYNWELNTGISGDSGDCMQALPNTGVNCGDGSMAGPVMDFNINFSTTGVYYFLLRMPAQVSGQDDSCNVGMDDAIFQSQVANSTGAWSWRKAANSVTITSGGLHALNIWMREDGCILDKIVLTTNASYTLAGSDTGPAESPRGGAVVTYTLTVNSGTGDGDYEEGDDVTIVADAPATGKAFSKWTGDTDHVANVNAASTIVTMPAHAVSVTATYVDVNYTLTVNSGTGDGSYTYGTVVNIAADAPATGKSFSHWSGDTATVANTSASSTTITMPASNAVITAIYVDNYYTLTVTSGTGDGSYTYGTVVNISADASPQGYAFSAWTGDTANVASVTSPNTTVTMPASNVNVTATYSSTSGDTFQESSGQVVMEVEHYSYLSAGTSPYDGASWQLNTTTSGDSGDSMQALPNSGLSTGDGSTAGPAMNFKINFGTTGVYYFLLRMPAEPSGQDDSTNVAFDGTLFQSQVANSTGAWSWRKAATSVTVSTTGLHTINLHMREDGCIVDKIVFTTNSSYAPTGTDTGPAESNRNGATTYALTVNSGTGDGNYAAGTVVSIVADTPPANYAFSHWSGDTANVANTNASSTTITMPAQAATVTAIYIPLYTLTVTSGAGSGQYIQGAVVSISASAPPTGKVFSAWTGNTAYVANVNAANTTVTMPAQAVSVTATYVNVNYTLTVNSGTGGGSYTYQTVVNIAANAAPTGKTFSKWTGDTATVANVNSASTTITMPAANAVVTATYSNINYTLTVNSGSGDGTYVYQQVVSIVADTPQTGYIFNKWTGDTTGISNIYAASTTITMPAANAVITATYTASVYTLTVTNGTGDGNYTAGTVVNIVADAPASGYQFSKWTGDTANVANVNASSTSITMPAANTVVTATYTPILYALTVTSGTGDGNYEAGEVVDVVADTAPNGYQFSKWTGDTDHVANYLASSTTVTMPSHAVSITASYVAVYTLTVTSGTGDGTYPQGQVVSIVADTAPQNYTFDHWTGDTANVANTAASSTSITMPAADATVTALYKPSGNGDTFQESSGQVVMEVENYSSKAAGTGSYTSYNWTLVTNVSGDSGDSMQVQPNNGTNCTTTAGCVMNFKINFSTTGSYYVYCRIPGLPNADNKINYGMDGTLVNYWTQSDTSNWQWKKSSAISVTSTGVKTLNLWQKLDGAICDKLVMTTNSSYAPAGSDTGPAESSKQ